MAFLWVRNRFRVLSRVVRRLQCAVVGVILGVCLLSSCGQAPAPLIGYVDADYTYVSSGFSGDLEKLLVRRGQSVTINTPLFTLDPQPEQARLESAKARLEQALSTEEQQVADVTLQQDKYQRRLKLNQQGSLSIEDLEISNTQLKQSTDALAAQKSTVASLIDEVNENTWSLSQKSKVSPVSGYVLDTFYTPGEYVSAGQPVVALFAPENIKIIFYIPESMHAMVQYSQSIKVYCTGCREPVEAKITYIAPNAEYTPPVIYSEHARENLIYRIEAKPVKTGAHYPLSPGQVVSVNLMSADKI